MTAKQKKILLEFLKAILYALLGGAGFNAAGF